MVCFDLISIAFSDSARCITKQTKTIKFHLYLNFNQSQNEKEQMDNSDAFDTSQY